MEISDEVVSLIEDLDMEFEDAMFSGKKVQKIEVGTKIEEMFESFYPMWDHKLNGFDVVCLDSMPESDHRLVVS